MKPFSPAHLADRNDPQLRRLAFPRRYEQLAIKIGRALAYVAPRLKQRQYDPCQAVIPIQKLSYTSVSDL
ncbi:hypothetical protein WGT02_33315 (plasmid) [Rhizobium sp. T1470]|uniref:hypothetical protein n=1 Tax=Rhizobium sp. T1470 TaxID=555320 RepID=UPI00296F698D|nr:hypothetical protein [Rhizobium sp. T1473]